VNILSSISSSFVSHYRDNIGSILLIIVILGLLAAAHIIGWLMRNLVDSRRSMRQEAKDDKRQPEDVLSTRQLIRHKDSWLYGLPEIVTKANWSYLAMRGGVIFAVGFGMLPLIQSFNEGDLVGSFSRLLFGLAWILTMVVLVSVAPIDWLVLPRIPNVREILLRNLPVGIVENACFIGLGATAHGVLQGEATGSLHFWAVASMFFGLGLGTIAALYSIHSLFTPWNFRKGFKEDNAAAESGTTVVVKDRTASAVESASVIVVFGFIVMASIPADFTGWTEPIGIYLANVVLCAILFYAGRWALNKLVMREYTTKAIQEEGAITGAALAGWIAFCLFGLSLGPLVDALL